jgi:hypothetical protein
MDTPDGMQEDVIKVALPMLNAMSKIGWTVNGIRWDSEIRSTVKFHARSLTRKSICVVCRENDVVNRQSWL